MSKSVTKRDRRTDGILSRVEFIEKLPFKDEESRHVAEWFVRRPKRCKELVAQEMNLNPSAFDEHVEEIIKRRLAKPARRAILYKGGSPVASLFDMAVKRVDAYAVRRAVYMAYGVWHSYWVNWIEVCHDGSEGDEPEGTPEELAAMKELAAKLAK